jgi:hypothetical protein
VVGEADDRPFTQHLVDRILDRATRGFVDDAKTSFSGLPTASSPHPVNLPATELTSVTVPRVSVTITASPILVCSHAPLALLVCIIFGLEAGHDLAPNHHIGTPGGGEHQQQHSKLRQRGYRVTPGCLRNRLLECRVLRALHVGHQGPYRVTQPLAGPARHQLAGGLESLFPAQRDSAFRELHAGRYLFLELCEPRLLFRTIRGQSL